MEAEHGFLLSGSSPHKVFVSVIVLALSIIVSVVSLSLASQRHIYSITLLTQTLWGNTNQVKVRVKGSTYVQISTKGNGNLGLVIRGLSQLGYTVAFVFHTVMYDH